MRELLREESDTAAELSGLAAEVHAQMVEAVRARAEEVLSGAEAAHEALLAEGRAELSAARNRAAGEVAEEVREQLVEEARLAEGALQRGALEELAAVAAGARERLGQEAREEMLEHAGAVFGRIVSPELSAAAAAARRELEEVARRRAEEMLAALRKREKLLCDKSTAEVESMVEEASSRVAAAAARARALAEEELRARAEGVAAAAAAQPLEAMEAAAKAYKEEEQQVLARSAEALEGVSERVEELREEASATFASELAGLRRSLQEETDAAAKLTRLECRAHTQMAEEAQGRVEEMLLAAEARQGRLHAEASAELAASLRSARRSSSEEVRDARDSWEAAFRTALSPELAAATAAARAELQEALHGAERQQAAGRAEALARVTSAAEEARSGLRAELRMASTEVLDIVTEARAQLRGELRGAAAAVEAATRLRAESQADVASVLHASAQSEESCKRSEAAAAECRQAAAEAQAQDVDPAEVVDTAVAEARKAVSRELRARSLELQQQLEAQQGALFEEAWQQSQEALKTAKASQRCADALVVSQAQLRESLCSEIHKMSRNGMDGCAADGSGGGGADERLAAHAGELEELRSAVGGTRRRLCETGRSISRLDEKLSDALVQLARLSSQDPHRPGAAAGQPHLALALSPEGDGRPGHRALPELRAELDERLEQQGAEFSHALREQARADSAALSAVQRSLERVTAEVASAMQKQQRWRPLEHEVAHEVLESLRPELRAELRGEVAEASSAAFGDLEETLRMREGLCGSLARKACMDLYPELRAEVRMGLVEEAAALSSTLQEQSAWSATELSRLQRTLEAVRRRSGEAEGRLAGELAETLRPELLEELRDALRGEGAVRGREEAAVHSQCLSIAAAKASGELEGLREDVRRQINEERRRLARDGGELQHELLERVSAHEAATADALSTAAAVAENHREARRELMEVAVSLQAVGQEACAAQARLDGELRAETLRRGEALDAQRVDITGELREALAAQRVDLAGELRELSRSLGSEASASLWTELAAHEGRTEGRFEAHVERLKASFTDLEHRMDHEARCMREEAAVGAEGAVAGAARSVAERLEEEGAVSGRARPPQVAAEMELALFQQGLVAELRREWQADLAEAFEEALAAAAGARQAQAAPPSAQRREQWQEPSAGDAAGEAARTGAVILVPGGSAAARSRTPSQQRRVTFALDATGQCEQLRSACAEVQRGLSELRRGLDEVPLEPRPLPPQRPQVTPRGCVEVQLTDSLAVGDGWPCRGAAQLASTSVDVLYERGTRAASSSASSSPVQVRGRDRRARGGNPSRRLPSESGEDGEEEVVLSP